MLKLAANLSANHEYYIGLTGQSNARPWGTLTDAKTLFADFGAELNGFTAPAASLGLPALPHTAGTVETITATPAELTPGQWSNTYLRLGTVTTPLVGYAKILTNTAGSLTVEWIVAATSGAASVAGYFIRLDFKWAKYPQVRVLVPYQPSSDSSTDRFLPYPAVNGGWLTLPPTTGPSFAQGRSLVLPAPYTVPAGVTSFENLGLLLDFSFAEGIAGYGISEIADSTGATPHPITSISALVCTFTNAIIADVLVGGCVIVEWDIGSGGMKRSWAKIVSNTTLTFTVDAWLGDGQPNSGSGTTGSVTHRYTAWIPHWQDSPHSYIPGEGFTYPTNEMQAGGFAGNIGSVQIRNRPRGIANRQYGDTFGDALVIASRLSSALGKRINLILLGVNSTPLGPNNTYTSFGLDAQIGWYDPQKSSTWDPAISTSLYHRVIKLISMMSTALLAEGSTKTAKCLGWIHEQGEGDALLGSARQHYYQSVRAFATGIRNAIDAAGHNPYANSAKVPFLQPRIMHIPYELIGTIAYYGGAPINFDGDVLGLVNSAIVDHGAADGFAGTIYTDDLPRNLPDAGHCNGVGEAERGARISDRLGGLIEYALSHGPADAVLNAPPRKIIDICNVALRLIGESYSITSLDDGSAQAAHCKNLLPEARDTLLQVRQWGFAKKRVRLDTIRKPDQFSYYQYDFCYVMPHDALNAFAVLAPNQLDPDFDENRVLDTGYSARFVTNRGHADPVTTTTTTQIGDVVAEGPPQPFAIEASQYGGRYIFTNQQQAILRYTARVLDADAYSPAFTSALQFYLASLLASAIIKGDEGEKVAERMRQRAAQMVGTAASSDGNQGKQQVAHIPDHIAAR